MPHFPSSFERVIGGGLTENDKANILRTLSDRFSDQEIPALTKRERPKTPEELRVILEVDRASNALRSRNGLRPLDISAANVHVIPANDWDIPGASALFAPLHQAIAIREMETTLAFAATLFHEFVHFKSYGALQAQREDPTPTIYRLGLVVRERRGEELLLRNMNEAVTEELTKGFVTGLRDHSLFHEDVEAIAALRKRYPESVDRTGRPLFTDDTIAAWESKGDVPDAELHVIDLGNKEARRNLGLLEDKLLGVEGTRTLFKRKEDLLDVFARAMLTGNILPLARLIDGAFGKGTLRRLAELDSDLIRQRAFIDSLS